VNGEVLQDSTTANLVFGIDEIVSYVSQTVTLEPGDLILTGTPAGVGIFRDPQRLLQPGDEVTIEIEGIGELTNPVVAG
jgi:2,4-didehydro-3-deoxy-L-rhamnonate hydrolase